MGDFTVQANRLLHICVQQWQSVWDGHGGGHDSALPVATTEFCNQARRRNLLPELRLSVGRSGDMPGRLYYHR